MRFVQKIVYCLLLCGVLTACNDKSDAETTRFRLRLTDGPLIVDSVNIDLRTIIIKGLDGERDSIELNTNSGIYNLLDYQNGVDTLIGYADLEMEGIKEIRLVLGPDNTIVVDGVSYPIATPSAQQSGLKIKTDIDLVPGEDYELVIDFDAEKSIVTKGNGDYSLKPVIKVVN